MEQEKDFNETESTQPKTEYQQNSANDNQEYSTSEAGDRRPYRPRFTRSYGERGGYRSSYQRAERPYRPQYKATVPLQGLICKGRFRQNATFFYQVET